MRIYFFKKTCIVGEVDNRNDMTPTPFQEAERNEETKQTLDSVTNIEDKGQFGEKDNQVCWLMEIRTGIFNSAFFLTLLSFALKVIVNLFLKFRYSTIINLLRHDYPATFSLFQKHY